MLTYSTIQFCLYSIKAVLKNECPGCKLNPLTNSLVKKQQECYKIDFRTKLRMHFTEWCRLECSHTFCFKCCTQFLVRVRDNGANGCLIRVFLKILKVMPVMFNHLYIRGVGMPSKRIHLLVSHHRMVCMEASSENIYPIFIFRQQQYLTRSLYRI